MQHTTPWYLPWGLKLVPLPIPQAHPVSGIHNPAGLHLLAPLPGIYAPEPRKVDNVFVKKKIKKFILYFQLMVENPIFLRIFILFCGK